MIDRRSIPIEITILAALGLALLGSLAFGEEGDTVGVETYTVACKAGDPLTIEVAPSTGRVELTFDNEACHCFMSAEDAASWIQTEGEKAMTGGDDFGLLFSGIDQMVAEPPLGDQVDVAAYCFTAEQVNSYLTSLTPADSAPADQ